MQRSRRGLAIALLVLSTGACSNGTARTAPSTNPLRESLLQARSAGADQSQLDILSKSAVSYADYESAMNRYFDCLKKAGYSVNLGGTGKQNGVTVLDYTIGLPAGRHAPPKGENDTLSYGCYTKFAMFVDGYWQASSPDALAFEQRRENALAPDLRSCLSKHGVDVPGDASFTDMIRQSTVLLEKTEFSCMDEIGYSEWQG